MSEHTPTPWQQHDDIVPYGIDYAPTVWGSSGPGYGFVADLRGCGKGGRAEAIENAKFIVKAVNGYDALVKFAQYVLEMDPESNAPLFENARKALIAAKVQP